MTPTPDSKERRQAWDGIRAAWVQHEEAAAAILNSISGWRLELNRRRALAAGKPVHYLDTALHQAQRFYALDRALIEP
jgi:oligoendopeptidase F